MQESITQPLAQSSGKYSPWQGLLDVFINPSRLGKALTAKPHWLIPAVLVFAISVITAFLLRDLYASEFASKLIEQSAKSGQSLDPADAERMGKNIFMLVAIVIGLLLPLCTACMLYLVGSFGMGLRNSFTRLFSAAAYTTWLFTFGGLLLVPFAIASGQLGFSVSLGVLLGPPEETNPLWVLLSKFSLFHIWEVIALSLISAEIFQSSRNKGYIIAVISLGVLSGLHVAFTAIGSMMQPS